jgi:hypothetical protein
MTLVPNGRRTALSAERARITTALRFLEDICTTFECENMTSP